MRARFLAENPCIAILIDRMTEKASKGYLIGVDGRRITMRRDATGKVMTHKALNTLLQCAGAVVMKYAMIFLNNWIKRDGVRCNKVIDMHKIIVHVKVGEFSETLIKGNTERSS